MKRRRRRMSTAVCNRKRLPRREQLKHSSTRRKPFRKIQNSLRSNSWIFLSQGLVFAAQAAPSPCADCLLFTDSRTHTIYVRRKGASTALPRRPFGLPEKTRYPISCPLRYVEAPLKQGSAWTRTAEIICFRTICTSPWCNFRCGEARCEENIR